MVLTKHISLHAKSVIAACAVSVLTAAVPACAQDTKAATSTSAETANLKKNIVGVWGLVSYKVEDKETGKMIDAMGSSPVGVSSSRLMGGLPSILKVVTDSRQKRMQTALI
ncbi:lipocalin-like domain-containing protein [Acetobacter papayae]|uniref:lipocalin-like domain-containing protein n=1 Tax=Acetobacter papayae TaxID=1076592 RepID=UPI001F1A6533|nr:lipocalin-like domain-containing protein [Acetobacter papayae]